MATNIAFNPLEFGEEVVFPKTLNEVMKLSVKRPKSSRTSKEKEEEVEILVIDGIEHGEEVAFVKFDVYVHGKEEGASGPGNSELAGSYVNAAQIREDGCTKITNSLKIRISELLEDLGAEGDESVMVALVPEAGIGLVSIGGVKIELAPYFFPLRMRPMT